MSKVDWSKAPEWATCVVNLSRHGVGVYDYHWSTRPEENARLMRCETGTEFEMSNADHWEIVEQRPTQVNDDRLANDLRSVPLPQRLGGNCHCTFTPLQQPSTAPDLLQQAAQLLAERGEQYDKSGNERSAAKIVAAFNIITGRDLTPGEGWLFQILLKSVRFYSNTETPHRDSLEDMIAYAALHAEEYLNDK